MCVYVWMFSESRFATVVVVTGVAWFLGMHDYLFCFLFSMLSPTTDLTTVH